MDMSSNSQLVKFYTLFVIFAEFDRLFIKLNFLHVTIKVGEGGGQPIGDLSLLFMSLFHGGGEGVGLFWTMSLNPQFFLKSFLIVIFVTFFFRISQNLKNLPWEPIKEGSTE